MRRNSTRSSVCINVLGISKVALYIATNPHPDIMCFQAGLYFEIKYHGPVISVVAVNVI